MDLFVVQELIVQFYIILMTRILLKMDNCCYVIWVPNIKVMFQILLLVSLLMVVLVNSRN